MYSLPILRASVRRKEVIDMIVKIGSKVKVNHPITCLNPDEYFEVVDMQFDPITNRCSVIGANTCWFGGTMIVEVLDE